MDIITKQFELSQMDRSVENQFLVDEDYNVPDNRPDIKRVVMSEGDLKITDLKPLENHFRILGKLEFQVLCETELLDPMYCCIEGALPFDEMIYIEDPDATFEVKCKSVDLKASIIHSRKLRLKAVVGVTIQSEKRKMEEIPIDIICDCKIHKKNENMELLKLHTAQKDVCRLKKEIVLPGTKESVGTILWTDVANRRVDTKLETDGMQLLGELQVFCFYESPDGKIDWVEQSVPYECKVESSGVDETMFHHVKAELEDVKADVGVDEDGETRVILIEGAIALKIAVYEEEKVEVLRDLYSQEKNCVLDSEEIFCEQLLLQNHSKCKVMERIAVPELQNNILQICHSKGRVVVENIEPEDTGIRLSGILYVNFLYVKSSDESPFDIWQGIVPFTHVIECGYTGEDLRYDVSTILEQLSVILQGGNEIEVKAALGFRGFFRKQERFEKINKIELEDISLEEIEKRPSVVGYVVKSGDDLWNLAKRYGTSKEAICQVNDLKDETLKQGDRLLIFKENVSIL